MGIRHGFHSEEWGGSPGDTSSPSGRLTAVLECYWIDKNWYWTDVTCDHSTIQARNSLAKCVICGIGPFILDHVIVILKMQESG
jgi:hypothetical protein